MTALIPTIDELQANQARLLQQSLAQAAQMANPANLNAVDLELARSNIKALSFVQAMGLYGVYRYLVDFIARQAIPNRSAGEFLDGWLATYSMPRKSATAASGLATGTGVPSTVLTTGTLMQASDGRQYRVTADAVVSGGGTFSVTVLAELAGQASNLAAGAPLSLLSPLVGIDAALLSGAPNGITGGADTETDAQAIYRLEQRLANEPRGGSPADYARWALSVPGITRAWGVRNPAGPASAGVIIMADGNSAPGLPTVGQQTLVREYIRDPRRGPPDELFVIIPTPVPINVTLSINLDSAAIRTAVGLALKDLFFREAAPGQAIPHSHLKEAISGVAGEYNHSVSFPVLTEGGSFTVPSFSHLLVLGSITFV